MESSWLAPCHLPWRHSIDSVKDYFGEKIGLYVVWQRHFTLWLMPAAFVGVLTWINVAYNSEPTSLLS